MPKKNSFSVVDVLTHDTNRKSLHIRTIGQYEYLHIKLQNRQNYDSVRNKIKKGEIIMLRGTSIFICDNCGHKFKALDIEYNCTALSAPQECPKCCSYRTMPENDLEFPGKSIYEDIWRKQSRTGNHNVICYYPSDRLENGLKECEEWNTQEHKEHKPQRNLQEEIESLLKQL